MTINRSPEEITAEAMAAVERALADICTGAPICTGDRTSICSGSRTSICAGGYQSPMTSPPIEAAEVRDFERPFLAKFRRG